ncbi:uncharacterized protein LOC130613240 [Hydractinia symbiolongicarpus]|uniref:uncharacterized protein LOC130613240 n=1 Tax=Hydractinia symbiolongicarpus TaxID=13093 RepID=UPI00254C6801|nr:uncharacterized protein LOC130613240 [Hydractinia symbiolongicarpus]
MKKVLRFLFILLSGVIPICKSFDIEDGVSFADKTTFAHNFVRDLHLVQNLEWDADLASEAQKYAEVLAVENSIQHSQGAKNGYYGENLYKGFDGFKRTKSVAEAVYYWYLEIGLYDFNNPAPNLEEVGHFTELVWRSTGRVGCGYSVAEMYGGLMTYIVCRYRPQGNLDGLFLQNVLPLRNGAFIPNSPNQLEAPIGCIDTFHDCVNWLGVCRQQVFRGLMLRYCKKTCNIC